jgi:hypothetical protein
VALLHATHRAPPWPQLANVEAMQLPPAVAVQQPFGQEAASQTQAPPTQRWPLAQTGPLPHLHAPPAQVSAPMPQLVQAPPPVPHALVEPTLQTLPLQQPVGHEVALQTHAPPTHAWPDTHIAPLPQAQPPIDEQPSAPMPQLMHVDPPVPHALADVVVQLVPEQQPLGHDFELHTHAPATHCWPGAHAAPLPH